MSSPPAPDVRHRARRAVRAEIAAIGTELLIDQGFDGTTVDQIAEAAGIARRTFFRYFATKEDVLLGDLLERGETVAAAVATRPAGETPWEALRHTLLEAQESWSDPGRELALGVMMLEVPSLHAKHLEKKTRWRELLVPVLAERIVRQQGVAADVATTRATAIAATALACLDVASEQWVRGGGSARLSDLYDDAVAAVRAD